MELLKELIQKLKSAQIDCPCEYHRGCNNTRKSIITDLEQMLSQMESDELSDAIYRSYHE